MRHAAAVVISTLVACSTATAEDTGPQELKGGAGLMPRVKLETTLGDIVLELNGEKAPLTVRNFLDYVESRHYDGLIFHRVVPTFMIQGGGYTPEMNEKREGLRPPIHNEWQNGLKNVRGSIAMARLGWNPSMPESKKQETANSATSQFFINLVDNPRFDQPQADGAAYAVFGRVVDGMEVVEKIRTTPVAEHPKLNMGPVAPVEPVVIRSAAVVGGYDREKLAAAAGAAAKAAAPAAGAGSAASNAGLDAYLARLAAETGKAIQKTGSGIYYVVLKEGAGPSPKATDRVEVHYTGWLLNGTEFDSSHKRGQPATFGLNQVIKGWTEGVSMMKVGEKRRLVIPPELGYGKRGSPPTIPPDAWLAFEIDLLSIP